MIKKGTEFNCPKCEELLMTTNRDINYLEPVSISDFTFEVQDGDRMDCPHCGTDYSVLFQQL